MNLVLHLRKDTRTCTINLKKKILKEQARESYKDAQAEANKDKGASC